VHGATLQSTVGSLQSKTEKFFSQHWLKMVRVACGAHICLGTLR